MAKKPGTNPKGEFAFFNVVYEDDSQRSNRRVPAELLGGLDGDEPARGFIMEQESRTLFCGDLFTQGGAGTVPITEGDILGPSEAFRRQMDYYAHSPQTTTTLERLASEAPRLLACMHGSAWRGDASKLLRALSESLAGRAELAAAA